MVRSLSSLAIAPIFIFKKHSLSSLLAGHLDILDGFT